MSSRPPNVKINSAIGNSGLLITRTLHRHKHQLRDFFNRHTCIRQCTTGAEKGGGDVCGTQECDRTASPALTSDEVRSGAVLPCSGGPERQATGALPQPTDNTHWGSHHLTEVSEESGDTPN